MNRRYYDRGQLAPSGGGGGLDGLMAGVVEQDFWPELTGGFGGVGLPWSATLWSSVDLVSPAGTLPAAISVLSGGSAPDGLLVVGATNGYSGAEYDMGSPLADGESAIFRMAVRASGTGSLGASQTHQVGVAAKTALGGSVTWSGFSVQRSNASWTTGANLDARGGASPTFAIAGTAWGSFLAGSVTVDTFDMRIERDGTSARFYFRPMRSRKWIRSVTNSAGTNMSLAQVVCVRIFTGSGNSADAVVYRFWRGTLPAQYT